MKNFKLKEMSLAKQWKDTSRDIGNCWWRINGKKNGRVNSKLDFKSQIEKRDLEISKGIGFITPSNFLCSAGNHADFLNEDF